MRLLVLVAGLALLGGCLSPAVQRADVPDPLPAGWTVHVEGRDAPVAQGLPQGRFHFEAQTDPLPNGSALLAVFEGIVPAGEWFLALSAQPADLATMPQGGATNLSVSYDLNGTRTQCPSEGADGTILPPGHSPDRCVAVLHLSAPAHQRLRIDARILEGAPGGSVVFFMTGATELDHVVDDTVPAPPPCERDHVVAVKVAGEARQVANPWPTSPEDLRARGLWNLGNALAHPTACQELYAEERALWRDLQQEVRAEGLDPDRPRVNGTQYWIQYLHWPATDDR
jgi:hypothetical protein